jgi:hypothetical protein
MELIICVAISINVLLAVVLLSLRQNPFYLAIWLSIWVNLLGLSGVFFYIGLTMGLKKAPPGPPGAESWTAISLTVIAIYLIFCDIIVICIPPRLSAWSKQSFIHAMIITSTIFLILTLIEVCIASQLP